MKSNKELIAIMGAGRMGRGIALTFAYQGYRVSLIDVKDRGSEEFQQLKSSALDEIKSQLEVLELGGVIPKESIPDILNRIGVSSIDDRAESWRPADILFEAVPEILDVKQRTFARICPLLSEKTLIASTTSAFSANELAEFVTRKERFMNTHWLNPAYLVPLVEVSPEEKDRKSVV